MAAKESRESSDHDRHSWSSDAGTPKTPVCNAQGGARQRAGKKYSLIKHFRTVMIHR